jgi:hypothetical protein
MPQTGREQLFMKILVFFAVITAITGVFNLCNANSLSLGDFGSSDYMQTIPGQSVPNLGVASTAVTSSGSTFGTQDYTTSTGYNHNITKVGSDLISGDTWTRSDGIGYESVYIPASGLPLAFIDLAGASPINNVYDVTYHIQNQFGNEPFYTLISGSEVGGGQISGFYVGYDSNGIYAVNINDVYNHLSSSSFPYASSGTTIQSLYDFQQGTVTIIIDGTTAGTLTGLSYGGTSAGSGAASNSGVYYAGMAASHWGLQLSSVDGTFILSQPFDFWSDMLSKINGLVIFGTQFLSLLGSMIGLTSNALVPFWLWAIIAIPCLATLVLIYIEIARGD